MWPRPRTPTESVFGAYVVGRGEARLPRGVVSGNGRLEATEIDIATKAAGRVSEVRVYEGELIEAGQVVARMDTKGGAGPGSGHSWRARDPARARRAPRACFGSVKRLAVQTEDHPLEYADFEGVIREGQYGAGTVMIWDRGTWTPEAADVEGSLERGVLKFPLHGTKLRGSWALIRTARGAWLLVKQRDAFTATRDIATAAPRSVVTRRLLAEIAREGGGDVRAAATGDPPGKGRPA